MTIFKITNKIHELIAVDKAFLKDEDLSFEAKGLLASALAISRNVNIFSVETLIKNNPQHTDEFNIALKDLLKHGYISALDSNKVPEVH